MPSRATAISLFTSGGLGDLALAAADLEILVSNELAEDRHAIFSFNFPDVQCITGDIWKEARSIGRVARERLDGRELDLLYATPPCQGMSRTAGGNCSARSELAGNRRWIPATA